MWCCGWLLMVACLSSTLLQASSLPLSLLDIAKQLRLPLKHSNIPSRFVFNKLESFWFLNLSITKAFMSVVKMQKNVGAKLG
jgi:hypothetical protein